MSSQFKVAFFSFKKKKNLPTIKLLKCINVNSETLSKTKPESDQLPNGF